MEYDAEDRAANPPTLAEVCSRILALAAILWRTQLELHFQRDSNSEVLQQRFTQLNTWVLQEQLNDARSDAETQLHNLSLGAWNESQVFETMWRFEALVVLLWATCHFDEMPSWLEVVDGQTVMEKTQLLGSRESFLSDSRLREPAMIARMRHTAEFWHWRCRTEIMRRSGTPAPPGDTYEGTIGRALEHAVAEGIVIDTVDGDIAVDGVAYANLPQSVWANIASISIERHFACNWLAGYAPDNNWDRTPTST